MLVVMKPQATEEEIQAVCEHIQQLGFRAHPLPGAQRTAIGITGNKDRVEAGAFEVLAGVAEVIAVSKPYKLVSRDMKAENTRITFHGTDATIGGRDLAMVADGLFVEDHNNPDTALSDGAQTIFPEQFAHLMDESSQIAAILNRNVPRGIKVAETAPVAR